jgi:peptide/nickel transport system permease protein
MTTIPTPIPAPDVQPASAIPDPPPLPLAAQAMRDTLKSAGARFGVVWIALLAVCGIFAPFLASSHPIAVKVDGRWSSPMLQHLTPVDVVLVIVTSAAVLLAILRPFKFRYSLLALLAILTVSSAICYATIHPPQTVVYERYREMEKAGQVEKIYRTLIPYSANDRLRDQPDMRLKAPSRDHWMGTEATGADLLSRMMHASRIALAIGFISQGIAVAIGVVIGGVMGYFAGKVDIFGMRLIEIFEAIPRIFILIAITAFVGRNLYLMMAIIGLTAWTGEARFIRGEFFKLRKLDFVQAAIAAGLPLRSILFRHMLPNGVAPVLVSASFGVAGAILIETTLSFLGLGLVDEPSWGEMLNQARAGGLSFYWWIAIFPGLAIFLTVFAYNLIGEALRDALDPKLRGVK